MSEWGPHLTNTMIHTLGVEILLTIEATTICQILVIVERMIAREASYSFYILPWGHYERVGASSNRYHDSYAGC